MAYRACTVSDWPEDIGERAGEWLTSTDGGYKFDYNTNPTFGSPSRCVGIIATAGDAIVIGSASGSKTTTKVVRRLEERLNISAETVHLSPSEQYALIEAYDGYPRRIRHPSYREDQISEITRLKSIESHGDVDVDSVRAEARENGYPVLAGAIRKDGEVINFYFDDQCTFDGSERSEVTLEEAE